jgi:hypothetical protein
LDSFPSAGCFGFCLIWNNQGHLVSFLAFTTTRSFNAIVLQKGGGRYFRISVCLFLFAFVLCRSNRISKLELPLDWLRELHEPLLSFKPAINFIAPWFGLAPKPSQYFSRFVFGRRSLLVCSCHLEAHSESFLVFSFYLRSLVALLFFHFNFKKKKKKS